MAVEIYKSLSNLFRSSKRFLKHFLTNHIKMLYTDFDPIKSTEFYSIEELQFFSNEQQTRPIIYNSKYIFPCLLMIYVLLDSYYLIWLNGGYQPYEVVGIMMHYVYPEEFWPESDFLCHNGTWDAVLLLLSLIFFPNLSPKYQIYLHENKISGAVKLVSNDKGNVMDTY